MPPKSFLHHRATNQTQTHPFVFPSSQSGDGNGSGSPSTINSTILASRSHRISDGAICGIAIGLVALVSLALALTCFHVRRRRQHRRKPDETPPSSDRETQAREQQTHRPLRLPHERYAPKRKPSKAFPNHPTRRAPRPLSFIDRENHPRHPSRHQPCRNPTRSPTQDTRARWLLTSERIGGQTAHHP